MSSSRVVRVRPAEGRTGLEAAPQVLRDGIAEIQRELEVSPEFPAEVQAAAEAAVANPRLPDLDRTDLPLVTIDPAGAKDLDQALHLARTDDGYVLHYAIADLAAFITPGDPVDLEAHKRGQTLYGADSRVPLHPTVISEGGGSLLPDQDRPSLLWTITMDGEGEGTDVQVERAVVRSRAQFDYPGVQQAIDDGSADESLMLLREVGELRLEAGAGPRRRLAAAARAGGGHGGLGVGAHLPRPAAGRGVERPDVAAHRLRGGVADDVRPRRLPAHAAAAAPARPPAAAPHGPRARRRVARRADLRGLHPRPRRRRSRSTPR